MGRLKAAARPVLLLAWKDLLLELRSKETVTTVPVFALLVLVIFNFALDLSAARAADLAPGVLWVAFAFAGVLALNRAFFAEKERGSLEGLLMLPVSRDTIYFGKLLGGLAFMLAVEAVLVPVFAVMLNIRILSWELALTVALATVGFATLATLFSALLVHTRSREALLPLLFFPVVAPVVIGAVQATTSAVQGAGAGRWLAFLALYDAIFLIICPWLFGHLLEE